MTDTFPAIKPTTNSSRAQAPKLKEFTNGNGYVQFLPDGINNNLATISLQFTLKDADKISIDTFLNNHVGLTFYWTLPESGSTQKKYRCKEWSVVPFGRNTYSLSCTFIETKVN